MEHGADIDLDTIPNPKDCFPVPAGAVIPAGMPYWSVWKSGSVTWQPRGATTELSVDEASGLMFLTAEPIAAPVAPPTPEDSPIIITRTIKAEVEAGLLAVWASRDQGWCVVGSDGYTRWIGSDYITEWSSAIVAKTGHGVWDERDKRVRVDRYGETVKWMPVGATWRLHNERSYGSLAEIRRVFGDSYLAGFRDEQGDTENSNERSN